MLKTLHYLALVTLIVLQYSPSWAESLATSIDKSRYNLFNPTPENELRDFATDRPDKTESAYTVDAGHFQHETDIISFIYDSEGGESSSSLLAMAPNLKVGLTNNSDLQLVVQSYNYVREDSREGRKKQSGFGDILLRLKVNLWGNDGGTSAVAVMPYIKFPTNQGGLGNDALEGGFIVPYSVSLDDVWGLGGITQVDFVENEDRMGSHLDFINTLAIGRDFTDELGGYAEVWALLSPEASPEVTADFGLTYAWSTNTQLDCGINIGVTQAADDLNPFIGISQRF